MTERDALRLFLGVLLKNGVSRHISTLAEAGSVVLVYDCRTGEVTDIVIRSWHKGLSVGNVPNL